MVHIDHYGAYMRRAKFHVKAGRWARVLLFLSWPKFAKNCSFGACSLSTIAGSTISLARCSASTVPYSASISVLSLGSSSPPHHWISSSSRKVASFAFAAFSPPPDEPLGAKLRAYLVHRAWIGNIEKVGMKSCDPSWLSMIYSSSKLPCFYLRTSVPRREQIWLAGHFCSACVVPFNHFILQGWRFFSLVNVLGPRVVLGLQFLFQGLRSPLKRHLLLQGVLKIILRREDGHAGPSASSFNWDVPLTKFWGWRHKPKKCDQCWSTTMLFFLRCSP